MPADIASAIAGFERGIDAFTAALDRIPPQDLDRSPASGEWTPRQIALHIVDAEIVGAGRLRWVAAQPGSQLKGFAGDVWGRELHYEAQPLEDAVALFTLLRRTTAAMLRGLPAEAWSNTGIHEESGEVTLLKLLEDHCAHAETHVREIEERLLHVASGAA